MNQNIECIANKILLDSTPRSAWYKEKMRNEFYYFKMISKQNVGVVYPDTTSEEVYESFFISFVGEYAFNSIADVMITNKIIKVKEEINPLLFTQFFLLHEEGHWEHFNKYYKHKENQYLSDHKNIYITLGLNELENKVKNKNLNDEEKKQILVEYFKLYRSHPFEKYADDYAIIRIKELGA